jgi:uncharacterized protein (TIGR03382 family)
VNGADHARRHLIYGAQYCGSTTAILVNLPGETSSVVTDPRRPPRWRARAGPAPALAIAALARSSPARVATLFHRGRLAAARQTPRCSSGAPSTFALMALGLVGAVVLGERRHRQAYRVTCFGLLARH